MAHRPRRYSSRPLKVSLTLGVLLLASAGGGPATALPAVATTPVVTSPVEGPAPEATDTRIRVLSTSAPTAFGDPVQSFSENQWGAAELLLYPAPDGPKPWLAERVEWVDPTVWRITLHDGIRFQNGKPLDANALASWLRLGDLDPRSRCA
ncbi:MAG: hypothetical protein ACRDZO_25365 [Egibacteraceae bacterium]